MIQPSRIAELLEPFGLCLNADQIDKLLTYLELLIKWNSKINLVGRASAKEFVTRHFGESLFLTRCVDLKGRLLDIGSGAGFPGLALKIACPGLEVTLLEPVAKKRAFLKEVARLCQFDDVHILAERLEIFSSQTAGSKYDFSTSRAVGGLEGLVENTTKCLKPGARICLWLGREDAASISGSSYNFKWSQPRYIPLSQRREILIGDML